MIGETALKHVVQYQAPNSSIYGLTAMSRFVIVRNVPQNFDIKEFFCKFKIQKDTKSNKENMWQH